MNQLQRLLLLSSSRTHNTEFLQHALNDIRQFLNGHVRHAVFVPYAAVRLSCDEYTARVRDWFAPLDCVINGLHQVADMDQALNSTDAIIIGGGNTFHLLHELHRLELIEPLRKRIRQGTSFIGWSAGANIACPTIRTTNDMPVIWPPNCEALDLIPFQINPHYTDTHPTEHQGETRDERLAEFTVLNPAVPVVALREGSLLHIEHGTIRLLGERSARILHGHNSRDVAPGEWLTGLDGDDGKQRTR